MAAVWRAIQIRKFSRRTLQHEAIVYSSINNSIMSNNSFVSMTNGCQNMNKGYFENVHVQVE